MQGGVNSPLTFNIIIDDIIKALNDGGECLGLADDLVILVKGRLKLNWAINTLK